MDGRGVDRRWTLLLAFVVGCGAGKVDGPDPYAFRDDVESNADAGRLELVFKDVDGKTIDLKAYRGKKSVVLVFTRGARSDGYCSYCSAQTNRLIANYPEFVQRDAEVILVAPGDPKLIGKLLQSPDAAGSAPLRAPFPLVLDENLKAVDQLGIRADLAKPSTYILDRQGRVRFAYVGASTTDRPSLKAMLHQLDLINKETS